MMADKIALRKKWAQVIEHEDYAPIKDRYRASVIAQLMENTQVELGSAAAALNFLGESAPTNSMGGSSSTAGDGAVDIFDPVMISLMRRSFPNLVAYDIAGVQPMTGPTGLIFALRARAASQSGTELFYYEPNTAFSARGGANAAAADAGYTNATVVGGGANNVGANTTWTIPGVSNNAGGSTYNYAGGVSTAMAEGWGGNSTAIWPEIAFSIEKITVTAKERALKAEYSVELAQDLKRVHGLEAETLLSELLTAEILAEINREVIRAVNVTAVPGSQTDVASAGTFNLDVDSNGRWSVEKFKGLMFQLEREANMIAKTTRRGRGNIVVCSSDVASALQMAGVLDYAPAINNTLNIDDTGNTFAGILNGKFKVYIDPYAIGGNYFTIGYKGPSAMDSGLFYCPYVPLQKFKAVDPNTMQPKIGYKTRYGMVANPFADGATAAGDGVLRQDSNQYYRRTICTNIM